MGNATCLRSRGLLVVGEWLADEVLRARSTRVRIPTTDRSRAISRCFADAGADVRGFSLTGARTQKPTVCVVALDKAASHVGKYALKAPPRRRFAFRLFRASFVFERAQSSR